MDVEQEARVAQEARAMNLFLAVMFVTLIGLLLELVWGVPWRWMATTVILGVAIALAVPLTEAILCRPRGLLSRPDPDVDPDAAAWSQVMPAPVGVAPGRRPFPIPEQSINPPRWEPGQRRPGDEYFASEVEPVAAPEAPKSFSPVADSEQGRTVQFRRPDVN